MKMSKNRNNYEMPTNELFEDLLQENLKVTKPLTMDEREIAGEKHLFPFWNPVKTEDVHYSADSYLSAKEKKERELNNTNIVDKMDSIIGKINNTNMVDMTDVVKPKPNDLDSTKTTEQVTSWDSTSEQPLDIESNANIPKTDNVGVVKPSEENLDSTKTTKQVTSWDSTKNQHSEESNAVKPKHNNVGVVKPSEEGMNKTSSTEKVTSWDSTNNQEVIQNSYADSSNKNKSYNGVDFSKFM